LTQFEKIVLQMVDQFYRDLQGPVRTLLIADHMSKHDRIVRGILVRLEKRGEVVRKGQRGGWMPARVYQMQMHMALTA
jgi:predicted transcriptional regulator